MSDDRTIIDVFEEVLGVAFDLRWTKEISIDVPVARRLARAVKPYMRAFAYRKKILARCDLIFPTPMVISLALPMAPM
jgi:hypothetical protein